MSTTFRLATLIGSQVVSADGAKHGKVVDAVISDDGTHQVTELVVGFGGWIERLGMGEVIRTSTVRERRNRIAGDSIDRVENGTVYLKPDNA